MTYKLFTTPTCGYCPTVKKYLKMKGKQFTEVDASSHEVGRELQKRFGALTVPVLVREDGKHVVGLDYSKLNAIM